VLNGWSDRKVKSKEQRKRTEEWKQRRQETYLYNFFTKSLVEGIASSREAEVLPLVEATVDTPAPAVLLSSFL